MEPQMDADERRYESGVTEADIVHPVSPSEDTIVISFREGGNASAYVGAGWSYQEADHIWMEGDESVLTLPLQRPGSDHVIEIDMWPHVVPALLDSQHLEILANGAKIGACPVRGAGKLTTRLKGAMLEAPELTLVFRHPDALAPITYGGNDSRPLSLCVTELCLRSVTASETWAETAVSGDAEEENSEPLSSGPTPAIIKNPEPNTSGRENTQDQPTPFRTLVDTLSLLTPSDVDCEKLRLGSVNDGGYVVLDRLRPVQTVFSYGLDWNLSFDRALADRGHRIVMFDHSIDGLSRDHPNFLWVREGLAAEKTTDQRLSSISEHLQRYADSESDLILKIDAEGAEWNALALISEATLFRFEQIVVELHGLHQLADPPWQARARAALSNLRKHFHIHHVHANNCGYLAVVSGLTVPDVLEISCIRKDCVQARTSSTLYPTSLDWPNDPSKPDLPLWFFPFEPAVRERDAADLPRVRNEAADRIARQLPQLNEASVLPKPIATDDAPGGRKLKILCVSVHPVLEYDELQLFEQMGHEVFSLGFYFHWNLKNDLRPPMEESDWHRDCIHAFYTSSCSARTDPARWTVTVEFCGLFDLIVVHHNRHFIAANWAALSHSRVVWRTIGQEVHWAEQAMRKYRDLGVKIVRWSPEEQFIDDYIGADAVIRTCKAANEWKGWTGETARILTFNNNFRARAAGMSFSFHQECVSGMPFDLYGLGNDDVPNWKGVVTSGQQQELLRQYRVAFLTGTKPAPYTLGFVEAWLTGIPVVHVGRSQFSGGEKGVYEIDRLIKHGEDGFLVEDVAEAQNLFRELLDDHDLCKSVSSNARKSAAKIFGRERAAEEWTKFLDAHV